jgi:hypothetical protein
VSENRVLGGVWKREDVTEGWRKLFNEGLQESSWDSRVIK